MQKIKDVFKLDNRTYDLLKWITMTFIPVSTTAYVGLAAIWGFPYASEIAKTSAVICAFLGGLLGISSVQYYKNGDEPYDDDNYWLDDDEPKAGVEK